MIKKFVFFIFLLSGIATGVIAQNAASPYSIFGIGTLSNKALIYNNSMGGLGISNGKAWILNNVNPALLPLNNFSTFDAGLTVEKRTLTTTELQQSNINGGLGYLALGVPISPGKWTMAVGLMPYSSVSYNIITKGNVVNRDEADANYQYTGSGGINQVYLSSGWQLIPNFLYFGARAAYSFGTVEDESIIDINELLHVSGGDSISKKFNTTKFYRSSRYSDILFDAGLNMKKRFGKGMEVDLGFIYEFSSNMNTTRDERLEIVSGDIILPTDTIVYDGEGTTYLPQKYGVGISISKAFKWTFGLDFYARDWTQFTSDFGTEQELAQSYEIILGGEFTPDIASVKSYLQRVTYQFGFNYEQTPVKINNKNIDDFGINFGVSLPVGSASIFNFGFKYGQLGTTSDGLIREDYFRINLGMTFNDRSYGWYRNQNKYK